MTSSDSDTTIRFEQVQVSLGRRVRMYRKAQHLSILRLADMSGVNHAVLGEIERGLGNPRVSTLVKLAVSLDIDLVQLFADADETSDKGVVEYDAVTLPD